MCSYAAIHVCNIQSAPVIDKCALCGKISLHHLCQTELEARFKLDLPLMKVCLNCHSYRDFFLRVMQANEEEENEVESPPDSPVRRTTGNQLIDDEADLLWTEEMSAEQYFLAGKYFTKSKQDGLQLGVLLTIRIGMRGKDMEAIDRHIEEVKTAKIVKPSEVCVKDEFLTVEIKRRFQARRIVNEDALRVK